MPWTTERRTSGVRLTRHLALLLGVAALIVPPLVTPAAQTPAVGRTAERLRAGTPIRFGYRLDAKPFSYKDDAGRAAGYAVELCDMIAAGMGPGLSRAAIEWVPVTPDDRLPMLAEGRIDLLCGATTAALARRAQVSFSIPIFPGGVGAVMRTDLRKELRDVLAGRVQTSHPIWREAAAQALKSRAFIAVQGTSAEAWLAETSRDLQVVTELTTVSDFEAGLRRVVERKADAFFGERAVLLSTVPSHPQGHELTVVERQFTVEPLALGVAHGDEALRLIVDRTLSRLYRSGGIRPIYAKWFGAPDEQTMTYLRWQALPE